MFASPVSTIGDSGKPTPFRAFSEDLRPQSGLRDAITAAYRRPEPECLPPLITAAQSPTPEREAARRLATRLIEALRAKGGGSAVELLIQEYALSSQEGVALMCLAEALLRIPDRPTRDALIRDKIATGDWHAHLGHSASLFVNAATWGLVITGRLTSTSSERGLSTALTRLIGRGGEPLIRAGIDIAMRMLGEQFVADSAERGQLRLQLEHPDRQARGDTLGFFDEILGAGRIADLFGRHPEQFEPAGEVLRR